MRLVIARCTVDYTGRLEAHLPSAVRLLMVKADGCVAVHADGGAYKPLNWMNAPNRLVEHEGGWTVTNPKGERLEISIEEVLSDASHDLGADPGLQKDGVEAHLQALLAANCEAIAAGLRLVRREHPTDIGPVDLLCRDADGNTIAVEVKRRGEIDGSLSSNRPPQRRGQYVAVEVKRRVGLDAVEQLTRYLERMNHDPIFRPVRGILVGLSVAPQAKVVATSRGIQCVTVDYDVLRRTRPPDLTLF
ncbi:MAG TPA: endonuclease [Acidimicrobiales bacterium]